ncbi:MAG: hypothetical protein JO058_17125 [Alphaproteobacteria bacterium]|nr:hypothetical protein [Alphaproteobacteria bacterium]
MSVATAQTIGRSSDPDPHREGPFHGRGDLSSPSRSPIGERGPWLVPDLLDRQTAGRQQTEQLGLGAGVLRQLEPGAFTDAVFGVPTVTDILRELEKPGRDPHPAFKTASLPSGTTAPEARATTRAVTRAGCGDCPATSPARRCNRRLQADRPVPRERLQKPTAVIALWSISG